MCFLLAKSQEVNSPVNIEKALEYPLSAIPLSIAHADGEKRKTNKSALFDSALASTFSMQTVVPLGETKVYILDLAALICSIVKIPETFEELAMKVYNDISICYKIIYIVYDTYRNISIKSPER